MTGRVFINFKSALPYWRLFILAAVVLIMDQVTKFLVIHWVPVGTYYTPPPIPIIDNFLFLVHVHNTGSAWSLFADFQYWRWIISGIALIAIACVFFFRNYLELHRSKVQYAMGIICGGVLGNFIDRILYGYVIDFIDLHLPGYRWPAFNIADAGIDVGVIWYLLIIFFCRGKEDSKGALKV